MVKNVTGPRFWENVTYKYVIRSQRVNNLRDKLFGSNPVLGVAFDFKPIFGIQKISTLGRLTRSMRLVFRNLTIFKKILNYFEIFERIFENVPNKIRFCSLNKK